MNKKLTGGFVGLTALLMSKLLPFTTRGLAAIALTAGANIALAGNDSEDSATYCMDVVIEPFHMEIDGSCAVKDHMDGDLQERFYPFTEEEHLFNCDYFGPWTPLPNGVSVPSSVTGMISGTIDGYPFEADLLCASLTNWYQDSCSDPDDPSTCTFQLAQPMLSMGLPLPRITEVSVFDGVITASKGKQIPLVMATRAAGLMHLEDLANFLIGASITHSALGLATYDEEDDGKVELKVMDGSADLLLQGHIFAPNSVENDPGAAVIKGSICSKNLYKKLHRHGNKGRDDD